MGAVAFNGKKQIWTGTKSADYLIPAQYFGL
jgi:hypothetical protein